MGPAGSVGGATTQHALRGAGRRVALPSFAQMCMGVGSACAARQAGATAKRSKSKAERAAASAAPACEPARAPRVPAALSEPASPSTPGAPKGRDVSN